MENVIDFSKKKDIKDATKTNVLSDIDNAFTAISNSEIIETIDKVKNKFKTMGYKIQSTDKLVDKKKCLPKKTLLFKGLGIGFSATINKKFTDDFWVIYPVQIEPTNGFMHLSNFIQQKIEASKNGREK
ncbi:hypothetical protein [Pantoea agglomerans]